MGYLSLPIPVLLLERRIFEPQKKFSSPTHIKPGPGSNPVDQPSPKTKLPSPPPTPSPHQHFIGMTKLQPSPDPGSSSPAGWCLSSPPLHCWERARRHQPSPLARSQLLLRHLQRHFQLGEGRGEVGGRGHRRVGSRKELEESDSCCMKKRVQSQGMRWLGSSGCWRRTKGWSSSEMRLNQQLQKQLGWGWGAFLGQAPPSLTN